MFEIGIFCVIVLAISYWVVLWFMGRRDDVLHGEFVEGDAQPDEPLRSISGKQQVRPIFLEPLAPAAVPEQPTGPASAEPTFRSERLDSLLNAIKQDLNQLVRK